MIRVPAGDQVLATRSRLTFTVSAKETREKPWVAQIENLSSLQEAVERAGRLAAHEAGVLASAGLIYWTSRSPDIFNRSVLERGGASLGESAGRS